MDPRTLDSTDRQPEARTAFASRATLLVLCLIPVGYLGILFAVAVHEILGHGLAACLLGGRFEGFSLHLDGMGWARMSEAPGAPPWHSMVILSAGIAATTVVAVLLLPFVILLRRRIYLRLVLLLLAWMCLEDGLPYLFWNAYHPVPPGDVGRILSQIRLSDAASEATWRWILLLAGGAASLASTLGLSWLYFRLVTAVLGAGRPLAGLRRAVALILFLAIPVAAGWFLFDFDQLAPGLGVLPSCTGAAIILLWSLALYFVPARSFPTDERDRMTWRHAAAGWIGAAAAVASVVLWLQEGISWS
ncbi:MAG: M50 family metallopeptidase [Planctomycetes bacterium]|nr:M50 family metallopeptidase [Planctomycetota bacterium]